MANQGFVSCLVTQTQTQVSKIFAFPFPLVKQTNKQKNKRVMNFVQVLENNGYLSILPE